ncbi:MAG TPA: cytochrome c [Allosphingosinicella sp.]|nr:cytochrome c [Allosphingosinicella sp.]
MRYMALAALALAGCATGGPPAEDLEIEWAAGQPPAQLVEARQAAFHLSGAAMGNMKAAIERGDDPRSQAYAARGVARWARALPTTFPPSTEDFGPTRARPDIWANKPDFEAKAAAYAEAADALSAAASSGDRAAFAAAHAATAATCKACHDLYQVPQAR